MAKSSIPSLKYIVPSLNHEKVQPYIDYPVVYNATVTEEPFYVENPFTFTTSAAGSTTLYKWNGGGWTAITGMSNPDVLYGQGFYAVTTAIDASVAVTEHVDT